MLGPLAGSKVRYFFESCNVEVCESLDDIIIGVLQATIENATAERLGAAAQSTLRSAKRCQSYSTATQTFSGFLSHQQYRDFAQH
jgi:hypothetical protein